jgi:hypothetical protein
MTKLTNYILLLFPFTFIVGCGYNAEKVEIEHKIASKEKTINELAQQIENNIETYSKTESLRFTKGTIEQYEAVEYKNENGTVLISEIFSTQNSSYTRNFYYDNSNLVLIKEIGFNINEKEEYIPYENYVYYYNDGSSAAFTTDFNVADGEEKFDDMGNQVYDLKPIDLLSIHIDKNRYKRAINQEEEFELKFGEFLIIEPQSYLILENEKSEYDCALYIDQGDSLINHMFDNQNLYKGKTIKVNHEFLTMNGVERVVYKGGTVITTAQ